MIFFAFNVMIVAESLREKDCAVNFLAQILCPTWKIYRYFIIKNSHLSVEGPPDHRLRTMIIKSISRSVTYPTNFLK